MTETMYIFINTTLKMGHGKAAGQVGHLVQTIIEDILMLGMTSKVYKRYIDWKESGSTKIVLKATQEQINELIKCDGAHFVIDAGKTQIPSGSMTVVGFYPCKTNQFSEYKLY